MENCGEYLIHITDGKELIHTYFDISNLKADRREPVHFDFARTRYKELYEPLEEILLGESTDSSSYDKLATDL